MRLSVKPNAMTCISKKCRFCLFTLNWLWFSFILLQSDTPSFIVLQFMCCHNHQTHKRNLLFWWILREYILLLSLFLCIPRRSLPLMALCTISLIHLVFLSSRQKKVCYKVILKKSKFSILLYVKNTQ